MIQHTTAFFDRYPYFGFITGMVSVTLSSIGHFLTNDVTLRYVGWIGIYAGSLVAVGNLVSHTITRTKRIYRHYKNKRTPEAN